MKIGDLVRHKDGKFGIVQWPYNTSSWWHRKKGLVKTGVLMTDTGKIVWWDKKDFELMEPV